MRKERVGNNCWASDGDVVLSHLIFVQFGVIID